MVHVKFVNYGKMGTIKKLELLIGKIFSLKIIFNEKFFVRFFENLGKFVREIFFDLNKRKTYPKTFLILFFIIFFAKIVFVKLSRNSFRKK